MLLSIKNQYLKIPKTVRLFLTRALLFFLAWKLLYHLMLQPGRVLDAWLTNITAKATAWAWSLFQPDSRVLTGDPMDFVVVNGTKIVGIADGCNALELYILHIGFIICFPDKSLKRRLFFAVAGIAGIVVLNILRCAAIGWLTINNPSLVDFAHHYAFTLIVYAFVFFTWTKCVRF